MNTSLRQTEAGVPLIDTHIHLDHYSVSDQQTILADLFHSDVGSVISVSTNLSSCKHNLELARQFAPMVRPAFGYHPEQPLPSPAEISELLGWMAEHHDEMLAVGEVGLPYYSRQEAQSAGRAWDDHPYEHLLDQFIAFAKEHHKPVILHAVYEDADIACDLLEKHRHTRAHFHWFKGSRTTLRRMADQGYYLSFTPDLLYDDEIRDIARWYPEHLVMTETDGPWPFEGQFTGQMTHPRMTSAVAAAWADLRGITEHEGRKLLYNNAKRLYGL